MIRCVGILITIMFLIVGKVKYKTWANPLVIFNAAWLMIFWAYGYSQVFGVYQPTEIAQSIVFYGVLSVNVGMMLMQRKIKFDLNRWHRDTYGGDTEYVMQPMLMKICAGVALLLVLFGSIGAIRALIGGASFSDIRSSYFTGSTGVSQLKYYLEEYIGGPLQYVAITGAIIGIINRKPDFFVCGCAGITMVFQVLQSGGRFLMLNSIYILVITVLLFASRNMLSKNVKKWIVAGVLVMGVGIIILTNVRTTSYTSEMAWYERVLDTVYLYFVGSITYLGVVLEKYPWLCLSSYGLSFAAGYSSPFFAALAFLDIANYPQELNLIGTYACEQMAIGESRYYNALPTVFMYYYIDFGMPGVIIEGCIIGMIFMQLYRAYLKRKDWLSIANYALIIVVLLNTCTRNFLYAPSFALAFIYLRLCCKKKRVV